VRDGRFGAGSIRRKATSASNSLVLTVDLLPEGGPHRVHWPQTPEAWIAFTLALCPPGEGIEAFGRSCRETPFRLEKDEDVLRLDWTTPAGRLELEGGLAPASIEIQTARFRERIDGQPVPAVRISETRLAG
jgi:hypothetical protein